VDSNKVISKPQSDDIVLLDAERTLAFLARKLNEANRRIADLEQAKVLQQALIDSTQRRVQSMERLLLVKNEIQ